MSREKLALYRNDIIRNYSNGASAASIAKGFGVSTTTITRILKGAGLMQSKGRGEHMVRPDEPEIIAAFQSGEMPASIIVKFGVSKSGFYAILRKHGLVGRGLIPAPKTIDQKVAQAVAREVGASMNESEQAFSDLLTNHGIAFVPQVALGTGNLDFVLTGHSVAVELCLRGTFNKYLTNGWVTDRIKQCAERGWHFYVFAARDSSDINNNAIQDIISWAQFLDRAPPSRRQYRVVWCGTELLATGCSDQDHLAIEPPGRYALKMSDRKNKR